MSRFFTFVVFCMPLAATVLSVAAASASDVQKVSAQLEQLKRQARYTEAIELATQHIKTLRNSGEPALPEVGRMLTRLAEFNLLKGEIDRALKIYHEVLANFSMLKGAQRTIIRTALGNLTLLYMSRGQFNDAEKYAELMKQEIEIASKKKRSDAKIQEQNEPPPQNIALKMAAAPQSITPTPSRSDTAAADRTLSPLDVENSAASAVQPEKIGQYVASLPQPAKLSTHQSTAGPTDKTLNDYRNCQKPEINATVTNGGVLGIRIVSECLAEQFYQISYGEYRFRHQLSSTGEDVQRMDLFAGTQHPISVEFDGQIPILISVPKLAFKNTIKVALVWDKAVDLDLHAFEYAAKPGETGHIWSSTNRTFAETNRLVEAKKRAHGYISQSSSGNQGATNVEVYTLIRYPGQRFGAISLVLDFKSRGFEARPPFCGANELASVPFKVYRLELSGNVKIEAGLIPSIPCGQLMEHKERYLASTISDINLRQR